MRTCCRWARPWACCRGRGLLPWGRLGGCSGGRGLLLLGCPLSCGSLLGLHASAARRPAFRFGGPSGRAARHLVAERVGATRDGGEPLIGAASLGGFDLALLRPHLGSLGLDALLEPIQLGLPLSPPLAHLLVVSPFFFFCFLPPLGSASACSHSLFLFLFLFPSQSLLRPCRGPRTFALLGLLLRFGPCACACVRLAIALLCDPAFPLRRLGLEVASSFLLPSECLLRGSGCEWGRGLAD